MFRTKATVKPVKPAIAALCCIALGAASAPALADTRASSVLPLAQQSAVVGCAASGSGAATEVAAQGVPTQGCIFPLKAPPPPVAQPVTPAPPAPPAAPPVAAPSGGLGWLAPVLGGLAAIVGAFAIFGGSDNDGEVPGVSPG